MPSRRTLRLCFAVSVFSPTWAGVRSLPPEGHGRPSQSFPVRRCVEAGILAGRPRGIGQLWPSPPSGLPHAACSTVLLQVFPLAGVSAGPGQQLLSPVTPSAVWWNGGRENEKGPAAATAAAAGLGGPSGRRSQAVCLRSRKLRFPESGPRPPLVGPRVAGTAAERLLRAGRYPLPSGGAQFSLWPWALGRGSGAAACPA